MKINYDELDSIEMDGIDHDDYPKYCDAYICAASFKDGTELTEDELEELNEDCEFVHEQVYEWIY